MVKLVQGYLDPLLHKHGSHHKGLRRCDFIGSRTFYPSFQEELHGNPSGDLLANAASARGGIKSTTRAVVVVDELESAYSIVASTLK
jgi:hypothetical protein